MKSYDQIMQRLKEIEVYNFFGDDQDGFATSFFLAGQHIRLIVSWGMKWEHVSVSLEDRCPTWEEMCFVKDIFWHEEECVIQYHPPKSEYINCHPYCLHLWKPQRHTIPMPPKNLVG